jgi:preprotein translocase subunit SecE
LWVRFLPGLPENFNAVYHGRRFGRRRGVTMSPKNKKKLSIGQKINRFWRETIGELRKVTWPTPEEAWKMTKLVLIVMAFMSIVLGFLDFVFSRLITLLVAI